ncbi:alpha-L-rhamnosidase-related protein [Lentzea terrae]|uniref:alpha-L-rhamnosidase-related protein n=1 Tax=Lentzea terrae TaxID=2200761 RepID=UPI001E30B8E9|nr:hypothetical protein [Lentzea terrae]
MPNNALLSKEDYPSWGYEIGKGVTTIWERWNSIQPDGSFGPVDMNSFNHRAGQRHRRDRGSVRERRFGDGIGQAAPRGARRPRHHP